MAAAAAAAADEVVYCFMSAAIRLWTKTLQVEVPAEAPHYTHSTHHTHLLAVRAAAGFSLMFVDFSANICRYIYGI